jgi:hypothetical protein
MVETPNPKWKPNARASFLSYSLWNTMPDDALLDAAARGELDTAAGIEQTTREMLADPGTEDGLDSFVSERLRFDRVLSSARERRVYPPSDSLPGSARAQPRSIPGSTESWVCVQARRFGVDLFQIVSGRQKTGQIGMRVGERGLNAQGGAIGSFRQTGLARLGQHRAETVLRVCVFWIELVGFCEEYESVRILAKLSLNQSQIVPRPPHLTLRLRGAEQRVEGLLRLPGPEESVRQQA